MFVRTPGGLARLLLTISVAVRVLSAEDGPAAGDPFASYHNAIASRLSAILLHEPAQPHEVGEGAPIERQIKEDDIEIFATRFWGGRRSELATALGRLQRLRPALESILDSEGVPKELVAVVLIESGAQAQAISPRRARGLWQFIPETARQYGLTVDGRRDERVDIESATRAAARYLRDLYHHFGAWPLALAAYNAGQGSVEHALGTRKGSTFWQLSSAGLLPPETRSYVPAVLAAMQLLAPATIREAVPHDWVYAPATLLEARTP